MEEGLAKVVNLGAAEAEVDDMAVWVARSRRGEEENKRSAQRAAASRVSSMYDEEVRSLSASMCRTYSALRPKWVQAGIALEDFCMHVSCLMRAG